MYLLQETISKDRILSYMDIYSNQVENLLKIHRLEAVTVMESLQLVPIVISRLQNTYSIKNDHVIILLSLQ